MPGSVPKGKTKAGHETQKAAVPDDMDGFWSTTTGRGGGRGRGRNRRRSRRRSRSKLDLVWVDQAVRASAPSPLHCNDQPSESYR